MKQVHRVVPKMKGVQYERKIRQTVQGACGEWQDLLEASEWYLEAQGYRLNQEYPDALEDPGESEEGERVGSSLSTNISQCEMYNAIGAEVSNKTNKYKTSPLTTIIIFKMNAIL